MNSIHIQENKTINSFSILFFLLTFCLVHSLSAVSNFFYLSIFCHSSPILSRSLLMQSPIAVSIFLASISPPLSGHQLSANFSSPIFLHDQPMYSSTIFLRTFLHFILHSHFIHFPQPIANPGQSTTGVVSLQVAMRSCSVCGASRRLFPCTLYTRHSASAPSSRPSSPGHSSASSQTTTTASMTSTTPASPRTCPILPRMT